MQRIQDKEDTVRRTVAVHIDVSSKTHLGALLGPVVAPADLKRGSVNGAQRRLCHV